MLSLPLSGNYMMLLRKVIGIKLKPTMCIVVGTIQYLIYLWCPAHFSRLLKIHYQMLMVLPATHHQ